MARRPARRFGCLALCGYLLRSPDELAEQTTRERARDERRMLRSCEYWLAVLRHPRAKSRAVAPVTLALCAACVGVFYGGGEPVMAALRYVPGDAAPWHTCLSAALTHVGQRHLWSNLVLLAISGWLYELTEGSAGAGCVIAEPCDVYSTPAMIWDMEHHVRDLIVERLPRGFDSVGVHVAFDHAAATPLGSDVTIETAISAVHEKPSLALVEAETVISDGVGELGRGVHRRAIVPMALVSQRIRARQELLAQAERERCAERRGPDATA